MLADSVACACLSRPSNPYLLHRRVSKVILPMERSVVYLIKTGSTITPPIIPVSMPKSIPAKHAFLHVSFEALLSRSADGTNRKS
jgi:hypothetical protein